MENSGEAMESRWWTHEMANLVLRLYEQTGDPHIKTRCLNALDKMIEFRFRKYHCRTRETRAGVAGASETEDQPDPNHSPGVADSE
jgi:hypothetical protein